LGGNISSPESAGKDWLAGHKGQVYLDPPWPCISWPSDAIGKLENWHAGA